MMQLIDWEDLARVMSDSQIEVINKLLSKAEKDRALLVELNRNLWSMDCISWHDLVEIRVKVGKHLQENPQ